MNPSELETRVFACAAWLPLPVAAPLRAAEVAPHEPAERLEHLAHAAEALVQFLGSVVLLDAAAEHQNLSALPEGRTHAAFGLWRSILEQTTRNLKNPTLMELRALLKDRTLGPRFMEALARLSQVRNELSHPIRRVSAEAARRYIPVLLAGLDDALLSVHFLERYALVRLERRDDTRPDRVWLRPLVGPEAMRAPVMLRWPDSPPLHEVVLVSAEPRARWLTLSPLYRVDDDRALFAYGRVHDGRVEHYDVRDPDTVLPRPVDRPDWLRTCLIAVPPRQGKSDLGAEGLRLANLDATAAFDTSGPRAALGSASIPSLPPGSPAPSAPRRPAAIWMAVAVGAVAAAGILWWAGGREPRAATEDHAASAPAPAATTPPPGSGAIHVPNRAPAIILMQQMNEAQNAPDIARLRTAFLDPLDCYFNAEPTNPNRDKVRTLDHRFRDLLGRTHRVIDTNFVVATRRTEPAGFEEALVCEHFSEMRKDGNVLIQRGVRYLGLRQTDQGWRVFAEAGPLGDGSDSRCTRWLTKRFADGHWFIDEPEALSSFGDTPCGRVEPPPHTRR